MKLSPSNSKENNVNNQVHHAHHHHHHSSSLETSSPRCANVSNLSIGADSSNHNLDSSNPKCGESISSNEKEIEYLRVVYAYKSKSGLEQMSSPPLKDVAHSSSSFELTIEPNEIVKLVEDDQECLDYDKSWIKVFNSQGLTGIIPSKCVEPIILENGSNSEFVFLRRPALTGPLAHNSWYFGNISRFDTILLLNRYASNGDFLVRDSDVSHSFTLKIQKILQNLDNKLNDKLKF